MLPSVYASVENEVFPPDVCYSGEASSPSPPTWGVKPGCESQDSEIGSDIENSEDVNFGETEAPNENDGIFEEIIEGAVGGILPDLCNTGCRISSLSLDNNIGNETNNSDFKPPEIRQIVLDSKVLASDLQESSNAACSDNEASEYEETVESNATDNQEDPDKKSFEVNKSEDKALNHNNINLLPCETGDLKNKNARPDTKDDASNLCTESPVSACDMLGALEKDKEKTVNLEKLGLDLVRRNVLNSSHPSYHEWKCTAVIPSYLLSPVSLHSHGTSLGYEVGASIILGTGRTSSEAEASSEDEQIKMAKRFGLIRHLPCGIFDGSTKTRECVICMIDFSVGDRVRYLPCMHTYHTDCIDDWLVRSFTCPSCLEPVDAALLSTYETT